MKEQEYLKHIEDSIKEIREVNMVNSWAYEKVVHAILKIQKLPIILFKLPATSYIYRSRINTNLNLFSKVSDISSPEKKYVNKYGRANKPLQTLFYGSETRPVSYLEFANQLTNTTPIGEERMITMGAWKLLGEVELVLIFNPSLPRDNAYSKMHGEAFDEFITKTPAELRKGTIKFFEFIGEEYSKVAQEIDESYLITCAYTNIVFAYEESDGIMYPSVPLGGEGFNVALKETIYQNGFLELDAAMVDKFIAKKQDNGKPAFFNNASKHARRITGLDIEWEDNWQTF